MAHREHVFPVVVNLTRSQATVLAHALANETSSGQARRRAGQQQKGCAVSEQS